MTSSIQRMSAASPTRAERALATRRRMVRAAYDLFCGNGYLGTTINAVADEAGVAVPTVYYTFGTKAALLGEAHRRGDRRLRPVARAPAGADRHRRAAALARVVGGLRGGADLGRRRSTSSSLTASGSSQRVGPLVAAMHGASGDPEAAAVVRDRRGTPGGRLPGGGPRHRRQARRATPRTSPSARATDILVVLFSAELYQALAVGRGWSHARVDFFRQTLTTQLLGAEA